MATKQPHHKEAWQDLNRHFSKVTVGDMLNFLYAEGRLAQLEEAVPVIFTEDSSRIAWRKVLRSFVIRLKQWPERLWLSRGIAKVARLYVEPAKIRWPRAAPEMLPHEDPRINNYAYLVDLLASEYGWTEKQIRRVPFAAVNEMILAMEFRRVRERTDMANCMNLSEDTGQIIAEYPKRWHDLTGEERAMINEIRHKERFG